ncbi:hypothetical protein Q8A67_025367 [Cirrhinus molitorella]|uniref:phosphoglycerate mutase (2,3-diphosphoglycerate-dependent) n=1 Tax=Cirrhinus molitorella TaxID=172907 RepID=A0AA88NXJ0_9TELE|nr:hypothetical protein Q8A67_025367 [Cirrhinus molitorella]
MVEKQDKENERQQVLSERVPPLNFSGLSVQELQQLCKDLHHKIDVIDDERYDIAMKVAKNDKEIQEMNQKIYEIKSKLKRPNLKRVKLSAEHLLSVLLGSKHTQSIDFKANLKTVRKDEEKKEEVTDWRKNVEAMSGMEGRKKLFDAGQCSSSFALPMAAYNNSSGRSRITQRTKILKKASTLLAEEKEQKKIDRERTLSERVPPLKLSGLSVQDLQNLCKELHQKIDVVDEERYDIESKVAKNEKEIADLSHKIFELKGKMKRPALKRVRVSADAMLGALLGAKHKESIDFKANLKTVKKEEEKFLLQSCRYSLSWAVSNLKASIPLLLDVQKLSENGVVEAQECGRLLKEQGYQFDQVFTSILSRSIQTAWLVLEAMGQEWVPVTKSWRINERHYGALISLNRAEMALNHGEEQVKLWRRSYDITPPPIDESHPYYAEIYNDRRYSTCDVPKEELPKAESLKEVLDRLLPYWNDVIVPVIKSGQTVLISAHGNSCRALLKHLEDISETDIVNVTLPTGVPVLLELDEDLRPVKPRQLLGDQAKIQAAIKKVEDQGKYKPINQEEVLQCFLRRHFFSGTDVDLNIIVVDARSHFKTKLDSALKLAPVCNSLYPKSSV